MYPVDDLDQVVELTEFPQMDPPGPLPLVLADEGRLALVYGLADHWVRAHLEAEKGDEFSLIVEFHGPCCHMFGWPNEEVLKGHPLGKRGLTWYAVHEVQNSSWVRQLERMNSVHTRHNPDHFKGLKHYIFVFHDSTLEVVAKGYEYYVVPANERGLPLTYTLQVAKEFARKSSRS